MAAAVGMVEQFEHATPQQLRAALEALVPPETSREQRVAYIEQALRGPQGPMLRSAMGRWIVEQVVRPSALVPDAYKRWRPVVRDAMLFVISNLSASRLAPKLLEQLELPPQTRPERRLLRLIAMVPGLQKLGQVLARNRHLGPRLRRALIMLENGIHDVEAPEIAELARRQLGARLGRFDVRVNRRLLREASVSAILRFTWRNPETGERERGVFKVMKPYIPAFFSEDMLLLQHLTDYFGKRLHAYGFATDVLSDTFTKVRRLLQHEVDFRGEQRTLLQAHAMYRSIGGVRVPWLIEELCGPAITAMSEESGVKVTEAAARMSAGKRARLAERLVEALVAVPLFSGERDALFHADPHAGNLLYDERGDRLVILDWALTERLSRDQRRHLALLLLMLALRDPLAVCRAVESLQQSKAPLTLRRQRVIREFVSGYVSALPAAHVANAVDAMRLVEHLTLEGVRFPAALVMLSKVLFTLDGILADIAGGQAHFALAIARHVAQRWVGRCGAIAWPLKKADWVALNCSALLYPARVCIRCEEALLDRVLPGAARETRAA